MLMSLNLKPIDSEEIVTPYDDWAFKVFILSAIFIVFFAVDAIHNWNPLIARSCILLACIVPSCMTILPRIPSWFNTKNAPKEILWLLLLFALGIISSLLSVDMWTSLKSIILFIVAGPFIFVGTQYLLQSKTKQNTFLWVNSLTLLVICFYGIYEHNYNQSDYGAVMLFSGNPLPAGTLLILLSASPIILLHRQFSTKLKIFLALGPLISLSLVILSAKKSHILGLSIIFICLIIFINRKNLKFFVGFVLLSVTLLAFSGSTFSKYKNLINLNTSVLLRVENHFFGFHV